ncbi:MAG: hypothetical protein PHG47_08030 [Sulfuricella sp.]|nr:hypothetical protein [Sulfuricella sp.]
MPSPKLMLPALIFLSSLVSMMAWAAEKAPPPPAWIIPAENETYEIQITFLPDGGKGQKTTRQITLIRKDCEQNGNKSLEKEDANSFITVECHTDGNLLIRRSTLQPIGKLKQELNLVPVGTSRQEFLQGSDYYPDILFKISRLKIVKPIEPKGGEKKPAEKPSAKPSVSPIPKPGVKP